ncbi:MAG: hypothetical protein IKE31_10505 [Eubacterium sp.]|nr:hypothetical protein [Eubacterium sp.]
MKKKTRNWLIGIVIIVIAVILIAVPLSRQAHTEKSADSVKSITDTILQRALQCYVIEGAYPMSLEYLEENYGLTVNKEDYLIMYTPYAENLPPEVKVLYRHAQENS